MENHYGVANLQTLRLAELEADIDKASERLLSICANDGFFWLEADQDSELGKAIAYLADFNERLFDIEEEEKRRYPFETTGRGLCSGFKAAGTEPGAFGTPDGFELYMVPYNELLIDNYPHELVGPSIVKNEQEKMALHTATYHGVGLLLLNRLSQSLGQPQYQHLASAHDPQVPTTSSLTFLKYPDQQVGNEGGHVSHTDVGTLTFLYTLSPGLQIYHPARDAWEWVEPRRNCLLVNVGDSLALMTDRKLRSSLHRVIPHPSTGGTTRHSFAYFMRPIETAPLRMAGGQVLESVEWHLRKIKVFGAPLEVQTEANGVLLGDRSGGGAAAAFPDGYDAETLMRLVFGFAAKDTGEEGGRCITLEGMLNSTDGRVVLLQEYPPPGSHQSQWHGTATLFGIVGYWMQETLLLYMEYELGVIDDINTTPVQPLV
ncbi:Clavaminate synthase-like protein [Coniochaeta ligniaria NRRL 30616]|uniref:Clavaminate synthase-like protein n=1 Tax=Coniochaeta ligniaria NRRL 30616 TaxID=1408157 RepID=A0A1J7I4V6_9PEZI|nr:Clavaminate synthase-like protein [Coniochaeta ligniaria NRRL 30616]